MPWLALHRCIRPGLPALACLAATLLAGLPRACQASVFDDVAARASAMAAHAYVAPMPVAGSATLSYDQQRAIRFRPEHALWRAQRLPFEVQFFHPGFVHTDTVTMHEVDTNGQVRELPFDPSAFELGTGPLPAQAAPGYAGLRVHYALNRPDYKDEVIVFLGASYFRAVGQQQRYGLSARGLALDTTGPGPEEFPRFTEFWLEKPGPAARRLVVDALLDGPSLSGAYRFVITPGAETVVDVQARLFLRKDVHTLGLAALTSMFLSGENQPRPGDFRPEVHDSDGLLIESGTGEWLWRPLSDPGRILTTSFALPALKGFGLMQRDRGFASYEDDEARYERRPSAWVEPLGDWGPGRVELVELPTADETNDNIVAYWVPARTPAPGAPLDLAWRLHWQGDKAQTPPGSWVRQTRAGRGWTAQAPDDQQLVVDFDGPALRHLAADASVHAVVTAVANADITHADVYRSDATGAWRLVLRYRRHAPDQPVELRAFLQSGNDTLSETWSPVIPPLR